MNRKAVSALFALAAASALAADTIRLPVASVAEIADRISKDERYVSNQLYELKKKLRKHLEGNR